MNNLVHMRDRNRGWNVYCLNGSAHRKSTESVKFVTCPECRKRLGLDYIKEYDNDGSELES